MLTELINTSKSSADAEELIEVRLDHEIARSECEQVKINMMDHEPRLWSAEEPNLYILVLSLYDSSDQLLEAESCQVAPCTSHIRSAKLVRDKKVEKWSQLLISEFSLAAYILKLCRLRVRGLKLGLQSCFPVHRRTKSNAAA